MRLIDADALVRELEVGYCDECDRNLDCVHGRDCPIYDETTHIHEADTVEAVPIKPLAKWLGRFTSAPTMTVHRIMDISAQNDDFTAANTQCWEDFLRGMDWEGDE